MTCNAECSLGTNLATITLLIILAGISIYIIYRMFYEQFGNTLKGEKNG